MPPWVTHPGYTTLGHAGPDVDARVHGHGRKVLWAHNQHCVTLKTGLKSIWTRLSDIWLQFKAHVARITLVQRPQLTYVYPIHLTFYQDLAHYPNENVS